MGKHPAIGTTIRFSGNPEELWISEYHPVVQKYAELYLAHSYDEAMGTLHSEGINLNLISHDGDGLLYLVVGFGYRVTG